MPTMMSARSSRAISSLMAGVSTGWGIRATLPPNPVFAPVAPVARVTATFDPGRRAQQPRSATRHHHHGPVLAALAGVVAPVRRLVRDLLESEGPPLREPHLDRRADVHRPAGQLAPVEDRIEDALPLQERHVQERLLVEPQEVRGHEGRGLLVRPGESGLVGALERLAPAGHRALADEPVLDPVAGRLHGVHPDADPGAL